MKMKKKEKEKRKKEETQKMEKEIHERHCPLQKIFPSTKLGNNITLIKRRPGKNTTPISHNPGKLNQNHQTSSKQRQSSFEIPSHTNLIHLPLKGESPKYRLQSNRTAIYKKTQALGNSRSRSKFSINQH